MKSYEMLKIIKLLICVFIVFSINKISFANNLECSNKEKDIKCNNIISIQKNNASDLGSYNLNINIIKVKELSGIFNANMNISAGLCSENLEIRMEEIIQIPQALKYKSYNFPLYLHRKKIEEDFCVELLINNCIDTCGDVIKLEAILSPIMQMQQR